VGGDLEGNGGFEGIYLHRLRKNMETLIQDSRYWEKITNDFYQ
jgi:hypothetical protein